MADIFSKAAKAAKQAKIAKQAEAVKPAAAPAVQVEAKQTESKDVYSSLSDRLQKSVIYAAFYAVYQKSGSLYNQASVEGLLENVNKALTDDEYDMFVYNIGLIASALSAIQGNIKSPLSASDIIESALAEAPNESPKAVINRLISEKAISGADARRYLERLLGW